MDLATDNEITPSGTAATRDLRAVMRDKVVLLTDVDYLRFHSHDL